MATTTLNGNLYASMIRGGSVNLGKNRQVVNDLNVFPIPDGDTGDNMYMTIEAGCHAAEPTETSLSDVSSRAARGMLLGARGNSGVILSRIFAGIAKRLADCEEADIATVGEAFSEGVKEAYSAVTVPVEGTILTVYRDAVEYANSRIIETTTLQEYFRAFTEELRRSLEKTPELLAVLKEAGVVDSGGAGFVYIAEGMRSVLEGEIFDEETVGLSTAHKVIDTSAFNEDSVMVYGYCTEFLLQLQNAKLDISAFDTEGFADYLRSVGDSVVCFKEGSIVKVHVHTMTPGAVLEYCRRYGEFLTVKIENMTLQHSGTEIKNSFTPPKVERKKKYAIVAVACGEGVAKTFTELGADYVVHGGQSMNPSAEDFITAFDAVNAETVFVLPNNGNILLTARQAASLYEKSDIHVLESRTIGDGYAALSMFDYGSDDAETIASDAASAMEGIITGEVSRAVRDSVSGGVTVQKGDYLGFVGSRILSDAASGKDAAMGLAAAVMTEPRDVVIIICGADAGEDEARELYDALSKTYKRTEFIMLDGGQAVYDYILIFE